MELHPVGSDYEQTVGALNEYRRDNNGNQPGDPARAAKIIIDVVNSDAPPRRLILGADAVKSAQQAAAARAAETEMWAVVSRAADAPPA
jgi:hypothetical protein